MKNFYESTIIKPELALDVKLRAQPVGLVHYHIQINDKEWLGCMDQPQVFETSIDLTATINIQIQIDRQHPEALEIDLEIDGFKILPLYQHLISTDNCYINTNDVYRFSIPNFYPWYHEVTGQGWIV